MFTGHWVRRSADGAPTEPLVSADQTALHLALDVDEPDIELVRLLLSRGADVCARDSQYRAPVHLAIEEGAHEALSLLIEASADLTVGNKDIGMDNTCLHHATLRADVSSIRLLAAAGAALDARGRDGWTALCLAARSGSVPAAKALLAAGADPSLAMVSGKTALEIATINKKVAIVKLLQDAAA